MPIVLTQIYVMNKKLILNCQPKSGAIQAEHKLSEYTTRIPFVHALWPITLKMPNAVVQTRNDAKLAWATNKYSTTQLDMQTPLRAHTFGELLLRSPKNT